MTDQPKPGPHLFPGKRTRAIPMNPGGPKSRRPTGFDESLPPRGDAALFGYLDTGVLLAFGATGEHEARLALLSRYRDRLSTVDDVRREVRRLANLDVRGTDSSEQEKIRAAKVADLALLAKPEIQPCPPAATSIVNAIFDQLHAYDEGQDWSVGGATANRPVRRNLAKHAGEAALIAHAIGVANCLLLTNDSGASAVAKSRDIAAWHFGHLLREFVCHDEHGITADRAATMFGEGTAVSGIHRQARPEDPKNWLTCSKTDAGSCGRCDPS